MALGKHLKRNSKQRQSENADDCCLLQTKSDLESCMDQWREFETWQEKCGGWLKEVETRLRDIDLKSALADKQAQLDKLKVGFLCLVVFCLSPSYETHTCMQMCIHTHTHTNTHIRIFILRLQVFLCPYDNISLSCTLLLVAVPGMVGCVVNWLCDLRHSHSRGLLMVHGTIDNDFATTLQ